MKKPIIRMENFSYIYPNISNKVLDKVSFTIHEGDFVGIIGCNKAGKSTLCQAMVGILPHIIGGQWDGDVYVDENNIADTDKCDVNSIIGIVFQDAESQFTQETVEDEIAFAMCNFGYDRKLMQERVREAATACGLMDKLGQSPFKLSGGQQQRLAVACILALRPRVIILDESTSQLDPIGRDEVFSLVTQLHASGSTIIMVDHNIEKIAEYVSKVMILHEGQIKEFDDARSVFQKVEQLAKYNVRVPQVTAAAAGLKGRVHYDTAPIDLKEALVTFKGLAGNGGKGRE